MRSKRQGKEAEFYPHFLKNTSPDSKSTSFQLKNNIRPYGYFLANHSTICQKSAKICPILINTASEGTQSWLFCRFQNPACPPPPHQHRLAVGIDLGTTNSLVATVRSGSAVCLPDSDGRATLPSVVRYLDGEVEVGKNALSAQKTDPLNTVSSAKRLIGRTLTDLAQEAQYLPYRFTPNERVVELNTRQGAKTPIEVSAEILKALKLRAEETLGWRFGRRRHHRSRLFRRCPTPSHQRCRAFGGLERIAPAQRADRRCDCLRAG